MKRTRDSLTWTVRMFLLAVGCAAAFGAADPVDPVDPNGPAKSEVLRKQIMDSQIQPLFLSITSVSQMDLDELISSLDRLEVPSAAAKVSEKPSPSSQAPADEVAKEEIQPPQAEEKPIAAEAAAADAPAAAPLDPEWLRRIDAVEQPVDPLALGDVLFQANQMERAERFYRMALEKTDSPEDPNWQWAIYQRANCLRRSRPSEARALYQELIQKAPSSSWNAAAKAQQATLAWFESMEASKLKRFVRDPNDLP